MPGTEPGAWDTFSARNIGLQVNRRMAQNFDRDAQQMRKRTTQALERILGLKTSSWPPLDRVAFENFALVLTLVPEARNWTRPEKIGLVQIIRAKANHDRDALPPSDPATCPTKKALLKIGQQQ